MTLGPSRTIMVLDPFYGPERGRCVVLVMRRDDKGHVTVLGAATIEQAWERIVLDQIATLKPDVIVSDRIDYNFICYALQTDPRAADVPIVPFNYTRIKKQIDVMKQKLWEYYDLGTLRNEVYLPELLTELRYRRSYLVDSLVLGLYYLWKPQQSMCEHRSIYND